MSVAIMSLVKIISALLFMCGTKCIARYPTMPLQYSNHNYVISTVAVTWDEAFVSCLQNGMELASITSIEEQNAVAAALASYPTINGVSHGYWISAHRHGTNGNSFVWFSSGKPVVFSMFVPGQPDNAGNKENCVEFYLSLGPKGYFWNDLPCATKIGYICQDRSEC